MTRFVRYCLLALGLLLVAPAFEVLSQTAPTQQQTDMLKNLPPEQREALMQQMLGGRNGTDVQDRSLQFPETVIPRTAEEMERQRRNTNMFGEPRLSGGD